MLSRFSRRTAGPQALALLIGSALFMVVLVAGCGHAISGLVGGHGSAGWCAFHGWRALHNLERGHPGWTVYQTWRAAHSCL